LDEIGAGLADRFGVTFRAFLFARGGGFVLEGITRTETETKGNVLFDYRESPVCPGKGIK
jgi:hypothetical protein